MSKFLFLFAVAFFVLATPVYAGEITVSGEGSVLIEPDMARVVLGVETQNQSALVAQTTNSETMTAVIAAIRAAGIDEGDIQTAHFFMHPMQDWRDGHGRIVGYQVSNSVNITVRDIDRVGAILAAATEAGANMSSSITFGLLDGTAAYNQALTQAVNDAEDKARTIAAALGGTLGNVINISEASWGFAPAVRMEAQFDMAMPAAAGAPVPVQGGELTITARVQATFGVR